MFSHFVCSYHILFKRGRTAVRHFLCRDRIFGITEIEVAFPILDITENKQNKWDFREKFHILINIWIVNTHHLEAIHVNRLFKSNQTSFIFHSLKI